MNKTIAVHECLFCPQTFGSATEKDDHTLEHFAQEKCTDCNQNLIRIGGNLYVLHNVVTCIRRELKTERHFESCVVGHSLPPNKQQEEFVETPFIHPSIKDEVPLKSEVETVQSPKQEGPPNCVPVAIHSINSIECTVESSNSVTNCFDGVEIKIEPEEIQPSDVELAPMRIPEPEPNLPTVGRKRKKKCNERTNEKCDLCGQIFYNKCSLRDHTVRKHSADNVIFCHRCARIFSTVSELQSHQDHCLSKFRKYREKQLKRIHGIQDVEDQNRRIFECYMCKSRTYKFKSSVDRHMRGSHPTADEQLNDVKLMCNICGKFLSCQASLGYHMLMHTGEKPFKCTHEGCGMRFSTLGNRNTHVKLHTKHRVPKKITPHQCNICSKYSASARSLRAHMQWNHDPNFKKPNKKEYAKCVICGREFYHKGNLRKHERDVHGMS